MTKEDKWSTADFEKSPIIRDLFPLTKYFLNYTDWPGIDDYQHLFKEHQLDLTPVPQSTVISDFEDQYEPRVYLKRELQTRTRNWHDFFNAMIWLKFPQTKSILNNLHYTQAMTRPKGSNRSLLENRITQFDECGAIIISKKSSLLDLVEQHKWRQLFIDSDNEFEDNFYCVVFGHAIYEKALTPYIGMTCHCLLIQNDELLDTVLQQNTDPLDHLVAQWWKTHSKHKHITLYPYPILGTPGYWPDQNNTFYQNTQYFR